MGTEGADAETDPWADAVSVNNASFNASTQEDDPFGDIVPITTRVADTVAENDPWGEPASRSNKTASYTSVDPFDEPASGFNGTASTARDSRTKAAPIVASTTAS